MKVIMTTTISGTRNGEPWPSVGEPIDLPDGEAADMIASGTVVAVQGKAEPDMTPETPESNIPKPTRRAKP